MRKITHGLLWFLLLLMNVGLLSASVGLVLLIWNYAPLIELHDFALMLGLVYTFLYVLLFIGVIGLDLIVLSKGIKCLLKEMVKDAEN